MVDLAVWLLVIELMGLVAFPLTFVLFRRLPDRGYTVAKPLALLLAAYLLWLLGLTHLIPNAPATIVGILILGAAVSGLLFYRSRRGMAQFVTSQWRILLTAEAVFLALFLAWAGLLSEFPGISHTEQPMDFAFLNGILQSQYFPPEDPWLAGHPISYYYFGHFMMALPMQLAGIPSNLGYNLALSLVPALVGVASFGLAYNLIRLSGGSGKAAIGFGLTAPLLIMLIGNLEGAMEFVHLRGWGGDGFWQWVSIKGLEGGATGGSGVFPDGGWWWWRATRVIDTLSGGQSLDYTITEFPFFSFILGDLHPHMMSLPFLLLTLSLGLNLFVSPERPGLGWLLRNPWAAGAIALSLGTLAFINAWDFPVYAALFGVMLLMKWYGSELIGPDNALTLNLPSNSTLLLNRGKAALGKAFLNVGLMFTPILAAAFLLFLPFYLSLSSQAAGILPTLAYPTRPFLFFLVMGLPFLLGLSFLLRQLPGLKRPGPVDGAAILLVGIVVLTPLLLWVALALAWGSLTNGVASTWGPVGWRILLTLPGLAVTGLAGFSALQRAGRGNDPVLAFPLLLLATAAYLLVGAELFYLADFFGNRMNTVFKVYYQAWLLLGIVGSFGLYYWHSRRRHPDSGPTLTSRWSWRRLGHYAWVGGAALLIAVSLYYSVGAVLERTGYFQPRHTLRDNTLDGLAYIRENDPAEYAAILWLRDRAAPARIVEAVGDDYSDYSRVSAATGRPTILGWKGHEHQWRGTTAPFDGREEDVARIYESGDPATVRQLLEKYNIRYVYLGSRERAKYNINRLPALDGLLEIAFEQDGVIIYELAH